MRIVYIANDGKEFDDEFDCQRYEWILDHPHLKDIKCYDKDGNQFEDIMTDDTYNYCKKVIVPTDEWAKELNDLAEYTGFCYYSHISEAGIWVFKEEGYRDGRFVKIEEHIKPKSFIEEFNKNKVSDEFLDSCDKAGKLFGRK